MTLVIVTLIALNLFAAGIVWRLYRKWADTEDVRAYLSETLGTVRGARDLAQSELGDLKAMNDMLRLQHESHVNEIGRLAEIRGEMVAFKAAIGCQTIEEVEALKAKVEGVEILNESHALALKNWTDVTGHQTAQEFLEKSKHRSRAPRKA